jgi:hypothetical protein
MVEYVVAEDWSGLASSDLDTEFSEVCYLVFSSIEYDHYWYDGVL